MILIIGGAFQGKKEYVLKNYNMSEDDVFSVSDENINPDKSIIDNFHIWVYSTVKKGDMPVDKINDMLKSLSDKIIISDEIGNGIVPTDKTERLYREQNGKVMQILARKADSVIRVYCGIGEVLK